MVYFDFLKINYYFFKYLIKLDFSGLWLFIKYMLLCINFYFKFDIFCYVII